jgi:hypothetical protein
LRLRFPGECQSAVQMSDFFGRRPSARFGWYGDGDSTPPVPPQQETTNLPHARGIILF